MSGSLCIHISPPWSSTFTSNRSSLPPKTVVRRNQCDIATIRRLCNGIELLFSSGENVAFQVIDGAASVAEAAATGGTAVMSSAAMITRTGEYRRHRFFPIMESIGW